MFACAPISVLVVEDDLEQRNSVVNWLNFVGQRALGVGSAEEAMDIVTSYMPDMVLMDVGLTGMNGISGVRNLLDMFPKAHYWLMTDWGRAEKHTEDLNELRKSNVRLLIKPLLPDDLLGALLDTNEGANSHIEGISPTRTKIEKAPISVVQVDEKELINLITSLLRSLNADKVVIFELNIDSRQVKILEQKGSSSLHSEALSGLIHSPVRDVAEDFQIVIVRNAQELERDRFQYLKPLLDFNSCIGVPIPARVHNRYALFLFFDALSNLSELTISRAENTALRVGGWLERKQFANQMASLHRTAVLGQLVRALVHETSGRLTPINLALERLQTACKSIKKNASISPDEVIEETNQAIKELEILSQQTQALVKTTRSFGRMTRTGTEEIVVLEHIIDESIDILRDAASNANVTINLKTSSKLFFTRAQVTYLQQVIVNILQNAIQQIHLIRPKKGGWVEISLNQAIHEGEHVLQVSIEDDGPGIHYRLWERIFEMDYTTREEGSGLGLYMSRSLIESQGGRVYVALSQILWGTSMVIELPYHV